MSFIVQNFLQNSVDEKNRGGKRSRVYPADSMRDIDYLPLRRQNRAANYNMQVPEYYVD
jgi:hypothetical protein